MPEYILGIDLGTYNSAAALAYVDDKNDVVRLTMVKDEFDSNEKKANEVISKYLKNDIWGVKRVDLILLIFFYLCFVFEQ